MQRAAYADPWSEIEQTTLGALPIPVSRRVAPQQKFRMAFVNG